MLFYTGFKVYRITVTACGFYHAELGNGKAVLDSDIETVKKVLSAFEKKSRS